jgi:DNA-binding NarL/FixJ family response regulator
VLAPEVTRRVLARLVARPPAVVVPAAAAVDRVAALTDRERDVLAALGRGLSNQGVAADLTISEATAKTHVSRVLAKLGVTSRVQAAIVARDAGLV